MEREQITRADFNLSHAAQHTEHGPQLFGAGLEDFSAAFYSYPHYKAVKQTSK
jgi:hypothetical protein